MVIVIAHFRARPDRRDEFAQLLCEVEAASREDDGCLNYGYYADVSDALSYVAVEEWRDMDALAAHLKQPHVARLVQAVPEMTEGELDIAAHEVAQSGPLPF